VSEFTALTSAEGPLWIKAHPSAELAFKLDKQEIRVFEALPF